MNIMPHIPAGTVTIPSSKSEAHRAIICASFANGKSRISNVTLSDDILATIEGLKALGAKIEVREEKGAKTAILEIGQYAEKNNEDIVIDCNESGSTLRFLMPVAVSLYDKVTFIGSGRLIERPLDVYFELFDKNNVLYEHGESYLPLGTHGKLKADNFEIAGNISSQFVTGLMLAAGINKGSTQINIKGKLESEPYVEITRDIMEKFGVKNIYNAKESKYHIESNGYSSSEFIVGGDWSHAGFWLLLGTNSHIKIKGLDINSKQGDKAIVDILKSMGADIFWEGDVLVSRKAKLMSVQIDVSQHPDLAPVIAAAMAVAEGKSRISGGKRLKIKESDRIQSVVNTIINMGGSAEATEDGMIIEGKSNLSGGMVSCYNDHRVAMMAGALSVYCKGNVAVSGYECVAKSYPEFWEDFKRLGGKI